MLVTIRIAPAMQLVVDGVPIALGQAPRAICEGHGTARYGSGGGWETGFQHSATLQDALAEAYAAGAPDPGRSLDGQFAYVVVDPAHRRVVAGCDPLGKCRLFHAKPDPDTLVLATSLEELLEIHGGGAIDEDYIADMLARNWHLGARTPFADIHKVQPGDVLHWPAARSVKNHWADWHPQPPSGLRTAQDHADRLRHMLAEAVAADTADVPADSIGCELSGGFDSSTVYRLARRNNAVASFSYVYPRSHEANEGRYIEAALGSDHARWFPIDADAAAPFSTELGRPLAEPANALIYAGWIEGFRAAAEQAGVSTILTGVGGDSVLFGDHPPPVHIADLLRTGRLATAIAQSRSWQNSQGEMRGLMHWLLAAGVQPLRRWADNRFLPPDEPPPPWIDADFARRTTIHARDSHRDWPRQATVAATLQMDGIRLGIHGIGTFYGPQAPLAFRHPLLSLPLLGFMQALPASLQRSPLCDRLLHRHAMREVLPDAILLRSSKGGPNQAIFSGLARSRRWQEKLCDDPIVARRGYVDLERWRAAVRLLVHGETRSLRLFLATAVLEAWFQQLPVAWARTDHRRQSAGTAPWSKMTSARAAK